MIHTFDPRKYGQPIRGRQNMNGDQHRPMPVTVLSDLTSYQDAAQVQAPKSTHTNSQSQTLKQIQTPMSAGTSNRIRIPDFDGSRYGKPLKSPLLSSRGEQDTKSNLNEQTPVQQIFAGPLALTPCPTHKDQSGSGQTKTETQDLPHCIDAGDGRPSNASVPSSLGERVNTNGSRGANASAYQQQQKTRKLTQKSTQAPFTRQTQRKPHFATNEFNVHDQTPKRNPEASTTPNQETPEEMLKRIQNQELREISYRNRGKDRDSTTSLRDLELARRPLPASTVRTLQSKLSSTQKTQKVSGNGDSPDANGDVQAGPGYAADQTSSVEYIDQARTQNRLAVSKLPNCGEPEAEKISQAHVSSSLASTENGSHFPVQDSRSQKSRNSRNSRWCNPAELKPIPTNIETDSNACGSDVPSDAATESNDSVSPMHHGKLFRSKPSNRPEYNLVGWDGNMQPPPVDWNDRPRFNNNTPTFKNAFNNWAKANVVRHTLEDHPFNIIPTEVVRNLNFHPDGLGMVRRNFVLDLNTAEGYGYGGELADTTKDSQPFNPLDWEEWAKLDCSLPDNRRIADETTDSLVTNWLTQHELLRRQAEAEAPKLTARQILESYKPAPNPNRPKINIYLRPAVKTDLSQITELYNWHVEYGPRTAEFGCIKQDEIAYRFEGCEENKLPFIVAVMKAKNRNQRSHETIVGFACAQDFTAHNFVERIAAEVEIYVHHAWLGQGVGRCLLDQLLDATDRGHMKKGGYDFTCAQELEHMYCAGGGRDLHLLVFVVRHWKSPRTAAGKGRGGRAFQSGNRIHDAADAPSEDDYTRWLKPWLEAWDFEEQGCLKGVGTKNGRFLNVSYLCKETKWQPCEGHIPEYFELKSAS